MIRNIRDRRKNPLRWKRITAIVEATSHDNSRDDADQVEPDNAHIGYDEWPETSVFDAIALADGLPYEATLYLYDLGDGIRAMTEDELLAAHATPEPARWPQPGDHMKFLNKNGYDAERERAATVFDVERTYTVKECNVEDFSHSIRFEGIDGRWNGVMFERVTEPARLGTLPLPKPTQDQQEYLDKVSRVSEYDLSAVIGGPRKPALDGAAALQEIRRIAANGLETNAEGTDNWNLFADIHQQVSLAVTLPPSGNGEKHR